MEAPEQILLDVNAMAQDKEYFNVGEFEVSQDNTLLAWAQETPTGEATQLASTLAAYNGGKRGNAPDSQPDRNADYASKVLAVLTRIQQQRAQRDGVHV